MCCVVVVALNQRLANCIGKCRSRGSEEVWILIMISGSTQVISFWLSWLFCLSMNSTCRYSLGDHEVSKSRVKEGPQNESLPEADARCSFLTGIEFKTQAKPCSSTRCGAGGSHQVYIKKMCLQSTGPS